MDPLLKAKEQIPCALSRKRRRRAYMPSLKGEEGESMCSISKAKEENS